MANPMMFLGIVFLYALGADTAYGVIVEQLQKGPTEPLVLSAGLMLLVSGIAFKLGAVPGHPWVPDVAQASPAPASAFLTIIGAMFLERPRGTVALLDRGAFFSFALSAALIVGLGLAAQALLDGALSKVTGIP